MALPNNALKYAIGLFGVDYAGGNALQSSNLLQHCRRSMMLVMQLIDHNSLHLFLAQRSSFTWRFEAIEVALELALIAIWSAIVGPIVSAIGATIARLNRPHKTWTYHFLTIYKSFAGFYHDLGDTKKKWLLWIWGILIAFSLLFLIGWIERNT